METCILCKKQTEGSVGAAGIKWSRVCQPCKDLEDKALAQRVDTLAKTLIALSKPYEEEIQSINYMVDLNTFRNDPDRLIGENHGSNSESN